MMLPKTASSVKVTTESNSITCDVVGTEDASPFFLKKTLGQHSLTKSVPLLATAALNGKTAQQVLQPECQ